jgi:hypothetical protein
MTLEPTLKAMWSAPALRIQPHLIRSTKSEEPHASA